MKTIVNYRKLWEIANSAVIPGGYHIHHKDGNRDNNSIENLICVSAEEHWRTHYEQGDPVALCGKFVQGAAEAGRKGGRAGKGWKYTPAQLENLIKARRESYKRMGGSKLKGRKLSDEIKNNILKALIGDKNGMYGKIHSEELKRKISENRKNKGTGKRGPASEEFKRQLKESRKKFFQSGGVSPVACIYLGYNEDGNLVFSRKPLRQILDILDISENEFRNIKTFCKNNPEKLHPKFKIKLVNDGKFYD